MPPTPCCSLPVFCEGSEVPDAYVAVRAHWMDLGAKDPGYVLDSTSIHQEGLILPGVKLISRGRVDPQIMAILRYNSRMPDTIIGDFNAQISAMRVGRASPPSDLGKVRFVDREYRDRSDNRTWGADRVRGGAGHARWTVVDPRLAGTTTGSPMI